MLSGPIYRLLIFVATPVSYFRSLYSLFGALYSLPGALSSLFGALYSLSGLCILSWGFVKYPDVSPPQSTPPNFVPAQGPCRRGKGRLSRICARLIDKEHFCNHYRWL